MGKKSVMQAKINLSSKRFKTVLSRVGPMWSLQLQLLLSEPILISHCLPAPTKYIYNYNSRLLAPKQLYQLTGSLYMTDSENFLRLQKTVSDAHALTRPLFFFDKKASNVAIICDFYYFKRQFTSCKLFQSQNKYAAILAQLFIPDHRQGHLFTSYSRF